MSVSYKMGVYGGGTGNTEDDPCYASMTFATFEEADAYGNDLLMRWTQPSDYCVTSSTAAVNAIYEGGRITHLSQGGSVVPVEEK